MKVKQVIESVELVKLVHSLDFETEFDDLITYDELKHIQNELSKHNLIIARVFNSNITDYKYVLLNIEEIEQPKGTTLVKFK